MKCSWRKRPKVLAVAIILGIGFLLLYFTPLFPFRAVYYIQKYHHDQELCYMDIPEDIGVVSAIDRILVENRESHLIICDKILIPLKLLLDKDLLRNYTSKAGVQCPDTNFRRHPNPESDLWIETKP